MEQSEVGRLISEIEEEYGENPVLGDEIGVNKVQSIRGETQLLHRGSVMPTNVFVADNNVKFGPLPQQFANQVHVWERWHVLSRISDSDEVSTTTIDEISERAFLNLLSDVDDPSILYLPMEEDLYKEVLTEIGLELGMLSNEVQIHWLDSVLDFDNGFLLSGDRFRVKQELTPQLNVKDQISNLSPEGDRLGFSLSEAETPEDVVFWYGTRLSDNVHVPYRGAVEIELP